MALLTWNVNGLDTNFDARFRVILKDIKEKIFHCQGMLRPEPSCILLQEMNETGLTQLLQDRWIREHYVVVPTKKEQWPRPDIGNVTLVSRTVPVLRAFSLEFYHHPCHPEISPMWRHALVVDVRLGVKSPARPHDGADERTLRIVNVHLESLVPGATYRPYQLQYASLLLQEANVHAGIIAGDMNFLVPMDWALPAWQGLADAWRGPEDGRGNTWGYQPPPPRETNIPPGRLDRVLYRANGKCAVDEPYRVGVGLKTNAGQWASDHFGLFSPGVRLLP